MTFILGFMPCEGLVESFFNFIEIPLEYCAFLSSVARCLIFAKSIIHTQNDQKSHIFCYDSLQKGLKIWKTPMDGP